MIDDDAIVAELMSLYLESLGHSTLLFSSATLALAEFKRDPLAFDLVITDYRMPELSGLDLAEAVWEVRAGTPVIFMSGYGQGLMLKVSGRGARTVFLQKPFRREDLVVALREVLDG